jgi:hypothetical protein
MTVKVRNLAVDRAVDAYVRWRGACIALEDAYAAWSTAGRAARSDTFAAYAAALESEAERADAYRRVLEAANATAGIAA